MEDKLKERLDNIQLEIDNVAKRANRDINDIKLLAVSKNHSIEKIKFLKKLGISTFGESRVQELLEKNEKISNIKWHFIGHLQRNKVKYLMRMDNLVLIHSLDSWRLAKEINKRAANNNRNMDLLLQVNVVNEKSKYGIELGEVYDFLRDATELKQINIIGLMTLAPYDAKKYELHKIFRELANKRQEMQNKNFDLKELSMGMSNDYQIAIEEGSTIVRIGSKLFGKRGG
ncbi:MAG: YggS family pyridoxal phosphate-dependent enzyme [bacterium]